MCYLNNYCSICLAHDKNVTSLMSIDINARGLLEHIIPEYVLQKGGPAKQICEDCLYDLHDIFKFRQKCMENMSVFNKYAQRLMQEYGPHKYLSVKVSDIFNYGISKEYSTNDEIDSNTEKLKTGHETESKDIEEIEQVLIKVENKIDNFHVKRELNEEFEVKSDSYSSEENTQENIAPTLDSNSQLLTSKKQNECSTENAITSNAINEKDLQTASSTSINKTDACGNSNSEGEFNETLPEDSEKRSSPQIRKKFENRKKNRYMDEKRHVCPICQKAFKRSSDLNRHVKIHSNNKPNSCDVCHKTFSRTGFVDKHKCLNRGVKPFSCDVCHKTFTRSCNLNEHKRIHSGVKPYSCDICHKTFRFCNAVKQHKRIHSDIKAYPCDVCSKTFTYIGNLNVHKRTHTGIKPFSCDICQKTFTRIQHLRLHKNRHSEVKSYSCDVCQKTFDCNNSLKLHKRIHSEIKPFSCDVCHKSFTYNGNLIVHKLIHNSINPYICNICKRTFCSKDYLKRHKRIHNRIPPEPQPD